VAAEHKRVRLCAKCVYHISGECSCWKCDGAKTVNDIKAEARAEFGASLLEKMDMQERAHVQDPENVVNPSWSLAKELIEEGMR